MRQWWGLCAGAATLVTVLVLPLRTSPRLNQTLRINSPAFENGESGTRAGFKTLRAPRRPWATPPSGVNWVAIAGRPYFCTSPCPLADPLVFPLPVA